ncbi:MAG: Rrf2 family transcriptional regulator, partial [Planctomycetota bacterium]
GGFQLSKKPGKINLLEIIEIIQGSMCVNRCLLDVHSCPRESQCPINSKLTELQDYMKMYLENIHLDELVKTRSEN